MFIKREDTARVMVARMAELCAELMTAGLIVEVFVGEAV